MEPGFQADIAAVREAGLNIMMSMKGDGKPVSFIEDCAVDLEDLADYTERLNDVFARHGTKGTWYAHASVGCLHVRPVLSMKDPARCRNDARGRRGMLCPGARIQRIAQRRARRRHRAQRVQRGDVRRAHRARFETVKDAFDPSGLLNPGRVVRPPRMDDRSLFRYGPGYAPVRDFTPKLDWSDHPGPLGGMLGAVEMCNNNGTCRAFDARCDVPVLARHPRRAAPDARARQHAAPRADRPAWRRRDGVGRAGERDGAVRVVQGVPARMPDRRRHGEDEDRSAGGARRAARRQRTRLADRRTAALCADRRAASRR